MGPEWRAASVEQVRVSPDARESPLTECASGHTRKNCLLSYESPRDIDCIADMKQPPHSCGEVTHSVLTLRRPM